MSSPPASEQSSIPADQRILAAAGLLFADLGFKGTSIQALADAAGVNRALIFYYYESKEGLYRRLIEGACEEFASQVEQSLRGLTSPEERLVAWVRLACETMSARPHLLRLILREIVGPAPAVLPVGKYTEDIEGGLRDIIEAGCRAGHFRNLDPLMTAISVFGILVTYFRRRYVTGQEFSAEAVADHVESLVLRGLLP